MIGYFLFIIFTLTLFTGKYKINKSYTTNQNLNNSALSPFLSFSPSLSLSYLWQDLGIPRQLNTKSRTSSNAYFLYMFPLSATCKNLKKKCYRIFLSIKLYSVWTNCCRIFLSNEKYSVWAILFLILITLVNVKIETKLWCECFMHHSYMFSHSMLCNPSQDLSTASKTRGPLTHIAHLSNNNCKWALKR